MRLRLLPVTGHSAFRLIGLALLAGAASGCSSDVSRFTNFNADQLTTASVRAPSASSLAPVGAIPNVQQNAVPQTVSQAFPGDLRSPNQGYADTTYTGSVARTVSSPRNLLAGQGAAAPAIARSTLPSPAASRLPTNSLPASVAGQPAPAPRKPVVEPPLHTASVPQQPFPGDVRGPGLMAPDPITTGSAPRDAGWSTIGATRVTLAPGETIYNLSKRYGVPAQEIIKANGIADASRVSAGQQLLIPVYVYSRSAPVSAPDSDPNTRSARSGTGLRGEARQDRLPTPEPAPDRDVAVLPSVPTLRSPQGTQASGATLTAKTAGPDQNGASSVYTVKSGDTLSRIARANGVSIDALKQANGLSGATIRIGQKLTIPESGARLVPDPMATASVPAGSATGASPKGYTAPQSAAAKDSVTDTAKTETASVAPAATGISKLRWPARGQVITGFAKTEDGRRNDGIDISLPAGTAIKAAENGVVIYSGDGLKEYGNTVLVRHDNGLVTVYAHAQSLNVKRGDKVNRGQVIASSGMTGVAKTPRLHFEVRKNATPVDPATYLE